MCAGAVIQARLKRVVYGCPDPKAGAVHSLYQVLQDTRLNHQVAVTSGVLAAESASLLQAFFSLPAGEGARGLRLLLCCSWIKHIIRGEKRGFFMNCFFSKRGTAGFSLIEIMAALGVLSVLLVIGLPTYNRYQRRSKAAEAKNFSQSNLYG